jgi:hypothetical protein
MPLENSGRWAFPSTASSGLPAVTFAALRRLGPGRRPTSLHAWPGLRPSCPGSATTIPTQPDHVWPVNEAPTFAERCGPESCLPRSGRDVYGRAGVQSVALPHVGYDYRNSRRALDQTCTGGSGSIMGCTQDEQDSAGADAGCWCRTVTCNASWLEPVPAAGTILLLILS